jgi:hypothetical protein
MRFGDGKRDASEEAIVTRMEPSGLAFGKPKDRRREIRGGASNDRQAMMSG